MKAADPDEDDGDDCRQDREHDQQLGEMAASDCHTSQMVFRLPRPCMSA